MRCRWRSLACACRIRVAARGRVSGAGHSPSLTLSPLSHCHSLRFCSKREIRLLNMRSFAFGNSAPPSISQFSPRPRAVCHDSLGTAYRGARPPPSQAPFDRRTPASGVGCGVCGWVAATSTTIMPPSSKHNYADAQSKGQPHVIF